MTLTLKALQASLDNHTLIGIHSDRGDSNKFALGWITALSDTCFCLEEVDEYAGPEGVTIQRLADIYHVQEGGPYTQTIQDLVDSNPAFASRLVDYRIADMSEALRDFHERKQIVSLALYNRLLYTGPILELDDKEVKIAVYSRLGVYESDHIFRISDLYRIEFAGRTEALVESVLQRRESGIS